MNVPKTASTPGRDPADFYPTPAYATLALLEAETFSGSIWDPMCGDGEIILALRQALGPNQRLAASDLHDYGFGVPHRDFMSYDPQRTHVANIITNPPFRHIDVMLPRMIAIADKVAVFARFSILEAGTRYPFFKAYPPNRINVMTERVTMYSRGRQVALALEGEGEGNGVFSCAWFIWDRTSTETFKVNLIAPGRKHAYANQTQRIRRTLIARAIARHHAQTGDERAAAYLERLAGAASGS